MLSLTRVARPSYYLCLRSGTLKVRVGVEPVSLASLAVFVRRPVELAAAPVGVQPLLDHETVECVAASVLFSTALCS